MRWWTERCRIWVLLLALVAAGWAFVSAGCKVDPSIQGPKRLAVGQTVNVEAAQGPEFVQGDFSLVDARGQTYDSSHSLVEYRFIDSRNVSFRIPAGIAAGAARVKLGADGVDGGYTLKLTIVRLAAILDSNGWLAAVDVDTGRTENSFLLGHGPFSVRASRDGSRIVATAAGDDVVHFLRLGGSGLEPYAPGVEDIGTKPVDAVFMNSGALVATQQGLAVVRQYQNGSTVLEGFLDTGPVNLMTGSPEAGRAVALALATTDGTETADYLYTVDLSGDDPVLEPQAVKLNPSELGWEPQSAWLDWTVGAVASPVLSSDGRFLFLSNRSDDRVVVVDPATGSLSDYADLPAEGEIQNADPFRLGLSFDDRKLVVLCGESSTAVVFGVTESGEIQYEGTVVLGAVPWDVGFVHGSVMYVLTESAVALVDLANLGAGPTLLQWEAASGAVAIAVQP